MKSFITPKIELHCHLDGSLRPETVLALAENLGIADDIKSIEEVRNELVAPVDCDSLDTYLKRFDLPIKVLQTAEALERVTFELMEDAAKENVKYIEIRFAPQLHTQNALTYEIIIESVVRGIRKAEESYEIRGNVILSYMRHCEEAGLFDLIDAGKKFLNKGVVAVDLCGGESDRFAHRFKKAMSYARDLGYHVTIHAGETGISQNITESILLLKAERIGHGVAMREDADAFECVRANGTFVECCPTSNIQTKAVRQMSEHPVDDYMNKDILITINTDNRTVSGTTMSRELDEMAKTFHWDEKTWQKVYDMSISAAFADEATKQWLLTFSR
ncbi:MAG: adenosine deaminase [Proteocatella sp.]